MPLLTVHNLKKSFVTRVLFENVSFEVESGDHIGFVGVNGCGKSTLFRILLGEEQADEGTVNIPGGTKIGSMNQNVSAEVCSLFDYVLQVFSELSAIEAETDRINSEIAAAGGDVDPKLIERQHALNEKYWADGGSTYRARTRSTLLGLGFTEDELSRSINSFSGGQRNKAQLAKLLLSGADVLLLDEPTKGLDAPFKKTLAALFEALKQRGVSILMVSHDIEFCAEAADRCGLFFDGGIVSENTAHRFFADNRTYTTAVHRMSETLVGNAVTEEDLLCALGKTSLRQNPDGGSASEQTPKLPTKTNEMPDEPQTARLIEYITQLAKAGFFDDATGVKENEVKEYFAVINQTN